MVNSRVNKSGLRYVHKSSDDGVTWESLADSTLIDPSCNAAILKLDENTLLFSNANSIQGRVNLTLKKSVDSGKTWDQGKPIYSGGSAYSDMTLISKNQVGIVFEKDNYSKVVFTSVVID
jgi:sialidase-1